MEKLTAQQLAMYLGQHCTIQHEHWPDHQDVISGFVIQEYQRNSDNMTVIPHLRTAISLTEDESKHIYKLIGGYDWPNFSGGTLNLRHTKTCKAFLWDTMQYSVMSSSPIQETLGHPLVWEYLLSIGIDLFEFLELGLAIELRNNI